MTIDQIKSYLLDGNQITDRIRVTELNEEVEQFNRLNPHKKLTIKDTLYPMDTYWNIPEKYKSLDLEKFIFTKLLDECSNGFSENQIAIRIERVKQELELYTKYNIIDVLRTLIYIVDTFISQKIVWGTGRGSSCSSYILYLIKLHDVDSVEYELDINEFFR